MATITLYAGKMNQMSSLLKDAKKSVSDYQSELFSLKSRTLNINRSVFRTGFYPAPGAKDGFPGNAQQKC